MVESTEK
jgi:translation initiation factor 5B